MCRMNGGWNKCGTQVRGVTRKYWGGGGGGGVEDCSR